jgi:hypothetical protein
MKCIANENAQKSCKRPLMQGAICNLHLQADTLQMLLFQKSEITRHP